MKGRITPDDLRPGKYVVVSEWLEIDDGDYWYRPPKRPTGVPLRVLAVALPFVTLELLPTRAKVVLDTREAVLLEVDVAYVRSLVPEFKPKRRSPPSLSEEKRETVRRYLLSTGTWEDCPRDDR